MACCDFVLIALHIDTENVVINIKIIGNLISTFPIHKHNATLHLMKSPFISLSRVLQFSVRNYLNLNFAFIDHNNIMPNQIFYRFLNFLCM